MKALISSFAMLSLIIIGQSCTEEIETNQRNTTIGFTILSSEHQPLVDLPPDTRLVLNIAAQNGEAVMEFEEVGYQYTGTGFQTTNLDLNWGNYTITDFFLVNEDDEIVYAIPVALDDGQSTDTSPLDIEFSLSTSGSPVDVNLELLDVRNLKPKKFGYSSFKKPGHRLSLVASLEGTSTPTTFDATILNGNDTVRHYALDAKVNQVSIPAGVTENYQLVITKEGHAPVSLKLLDILKTHPSKPIKASLAPAFTMLAFIDMDVSPVFDFSLGGAEGSSITVDWGDGSKEVIELNPMDVNLQHPYPAGGNYPITITGDLNKITYFYSFYGQGMIDAVSFHQLTELTEIRFGLTRGPRVLDLSQNSKLEFALLSGQDNLQKLILPEVHKISSLSLEGPNQFSTAAIDAVINNLHQNTVNHNIMNGALGLAATWYQEPDDETLVATPSAESLEKLRALREDYGWEVYPYPFD